MLLAGLFPGLQAILNAVGAADQRDLVHERVRYRRDRLGALAGEKGVLDLQRSLFVAEVLGEVVVEVLGPGTHAADIEREFRLQRIAAGLQVRPHGDADIGRHVEVGEAPAGRAFGDTGQQRLGHHPGLLGRHEDRQYAIGHLTRRPEPDRRDRGGIDGHVRIAVQDAFQRLAEAGRARALVGNLVELAVMLKCCFALQDLAQDLDIFAGTRHRLAERHAMPAFDHLRPGGADPQQESVVRQRLQGERRHRRASRGARLHLHDAGSRPDPRRAGKNPGRWRHRVGSVGLAAPHRVIAETFRLEHLFHRQAVGCSGIAQKHAESHGHLL